MFKIQIAHNFCLCLKKKLADFYRIFRRFFIYIFKFLVFKKDVPLTVSLAFLETRESPVWKELDVT